jgi:hypothetical protein
MKLWLQVLFAQGWLWRDRFPEQFAATKKPPLRATWVTFTPLVITVAGLLVMLDGRWWGLSVAAAGFGWFLFIAYPLRLDHVIGSTELWLSITWGSGFLTTAATASLIPMAVLTGDWEVLLVSLGLWLCAVTTWLRFVQANYLIFADPEGNSWRLDPEQNPRRPDRLGRWRDVLTLTYWHLPRQILFGTEPPRRTGGTA